jgi:hypothetical protein
MSNFRVTIIHHWEEDPVTYKHTNNHTNTSFHIQTIPRGNSLKTA